MTTIHIKLLMAGKSPKTISHVKPGQRWEDDNKMILQDYVVMKGKSQKSPNVSAFEIKVINP